MTRTDETIRNISRSAKGLVPIALLVLATGCVTIKAPDKPIEINLNVNIRQEVILSLKKDVGDLIKNNEELFPK